MLERILKFYTKYFAAWVVLFAVVAYVWPGPFVALREFNSTFFALTMFGIGAVLELEDFKRIAKKPWVVVIGCCAQYTIMPIGAFVIAKLFNLSDELTVGLILTGAAPGAMASNVMSYIAGADAAYSVSLTTVSTLLCPVLTPGLTYLLAGSALPVPFLKMFLGIIYMVVVPLFLGFAVRHFYKRRVEKILHIFPAISVTFIIFICSLVVALNKEHLARLSGLIVSIGIILNVYGMSAGYALATVFRMEIRQRRALAIEIGMQNAGLGTALALAYFGDIAALPAAAFVFICIITASILAGIWQRSK
jgi:BASS family bile acid:Na+ symporter